MSGEKMSKNVILDGYVFPEYDPEQGALYPRLVRNALLIIHEKYPYLYGVDELADKLEVTKHHLIREFTKHTGISPGRYLTKTRIKNAIELFAEPDYTIEVIGQLVGYSNGNYFCKVFRSETGLSPGEYRKKRCRRE